MRYQMQWVHSKTGEAILVAEIGQNDFLEPDGSVSSQMHDFAHECFMRSMDEGEWPGSGWTPWVIDQTSNLFWQRDPQGRYIRPVSPIEVDI